MLPIRRILFATGPGTQQALTPAAVRPAPVPTRARRWDSDRRGGSGSPRRRLVRLARRRGARAGGDPRARRRDPRRRRVTRLESGRVELRQTHQVAAGEGVVAGGTVGFVAGMLLGGPIGGALLGMLGG